MPKPFSTLDPATAKAVYDTLQVKTLIELRRALAARGTPVSAKTLHNWKKAGWKRQNAPVGQRSDPAKSIIQEARDAAEHIGLAADVLSDAALVAHDTRAMLINAGLLLGMVQQDIPRLMREDPRGLAAVVTAARKLIEGGLALMQEAREMAERSMRERLRLLPVPSDAHHGAAR
jgi:hypothetical protein